MSSVFKMILKRASKIDPSEFFCFNVFCVFSVKGGRGYFLNCFFFLRNVTNFKNWPFRIRLIFYKLKA